MTRTVILYTLGLVALLAILAGVAMMWAQLGVHMSIHGWIAYGLGAIGSFAVAGGLFHLTFKSAREGYDDMQKTGDGAD